jgi:hypothetical protein
MRRLFTICLLALSATALLVSAPASSTAGSKKTSKPSITRVLPMRVGVGGTLTITGKNFKSARSANTVIFRAPNGRSAFAKPRRASRGKLKVVVPGAVSRLLAGTPGRPKPTRLKLRVLAGKFSSFTPRRLSPVVTGFGTDEAPGGGSAPGRGSDGGAAAPGGGSGSPGGGGGGGGVIPGCDSGGPNGDHDGDLLGNAYETGIRTDPCSRDTDLDGVEDGYEQQSAVDLNHYPSTDPLPYPGKRPYPNALDPSDPATDYDGDGLRLGDEFTLWMRYELDGVPRGGRPNTLGNLLFSDGLQKSRVVDAPADTLTRWALEIRADGQLSDDERDGDGDGLGNWDEANGRMTEAWWIAQHDGNNEPKESKYPDLDFLDNEDTEPAFDAMADADMDGDGVLDGADDTDRDGLSNMFEVGRPDDWLTQAWAIDDEAEVVAVGPNPWAYTNPFNPCKPFRSERCHSHPPFGYYDSDEVPPIGPYPPAGFPGGGPVTPAG